MSNGIKASITKIKDETKVLTNKELKDYKDRVEANIKDLEIAIRTLEADQQELNAINNVIKKELHWRRFII